MSNSLNLQQLYSIVRERDQRINSYFKELPPELDQLFRGILEELGLTPTPERLLMLQKRFLHLREESLQLLFQQANLSPEEVHRWQLKIYEKVREFWLEEHRQLIEQLKPHLPPFYQRLVEGIHRLGVLFSQWQPVWTTQILHTINPELELEFGGDEAKILAFLQQEGLLDIGHFQEVGDRCYSVLVKGEDGKYRVASYREFFRREVEEGIKILEEVIGELEATPASPEEQKPQWLHYLRGLKEALEEEVVEELIPRWAEVDRRWMDVTTPLQMGHPLEYYEDKYRKAVALELDLRIQHPTLTSAVRPQIEEMYRQLCSDPRLLEVGLQNLNRVQLYISTPALFYGAELNGLFSAQVVPNDEVVSQQKGKKVFAFVEKVFYDLKARPKMRLAYEIFGEEFNNRLQQQLEDWELFFRLYDITTIGHEFGHILWVDRDTEVKMNRSGMYKNGEEWKATTGGLVAFFLNPEEQLVTPLLDDLISRGVSLISWMEVPEVLPYYIEGLIHLTGLFQTGLISFNGTQLQYHYSNYPQLKEWYIRHYRQLGELYTEKRDSWEFLSQFIRKEGKNYLPVDPEIAEFVRYYYRRYQEIGGEIWNG